MSGRPTAEQRREAFAEAMRDHHLSVVPEGSIDPKAVPADFFCEKAPEVKQRFQGVAQPAGLNL